MDEQTAKSKWCPMVRHVVGNDNFEGCANRVGLDMNPEISRCIASDCMLWVEDKPAREPSGHCGLAK